MVTATPPPPNSSSSNGKHGMTPEEQNAKMSKERAFLSGMLEGALKGDFTSVQSSVEAYSRNHIELSSVDILAQFKDAQQRTALHFACQSRPSSSTEEEADVSAGDDIVERLVDWLGTPACGDLLKAKDKDGLTALMLAAQHPNTKLAERRCRALIDAGATALARSKSGATALHYAAGAGTSALLIEFLYSHGRVALTTSAKKGGTPLHWVAALRGDYTQTTMKALCEVFQAPTSSSSASTPNKKKQEWLNLPNEHGLPAVMMAAAAGNDAHSKYLVQQGCDITQVINPGSVTLCHMAADLNLVGTLAVIIERDGPSHPLLTQANSNGETPLDLAVAENHLGCFMLLTGVNDEEEAKTMLLGEREKRKATNDGMKPPKSEEPKPPTSNKGDSDEIESKALHRALEVMKKTVTEADVEKAAAIKKQGNVAFAKKEWPTAIELYTQAIEINPKDATFYSNRSACYMMLKTTKDYQLALSDAVLARQLKPDWPKACYRMAMARLALGRFEDAAVSAWEGLQQDPQNDELKSLLQKCVKKGRQDHLAKEAGER